MKLKSFCLGIVLFAAMGPVNATSVASAEIFWNTLTITANTADITNTIIWSAQEDLIDTTYWEVDDTTVITTYHDIIPNAGWATMQTTNDGGPLVDAETSVSSTSLSADVTTILNSEASAYVQRFGSFAAPLTGTYTFSVDYTVSGTIDASNTELDGPLSLQPVAFPYVELQFQNLNSGDFVFVADDSVLIDNEFNSQTSTGTLSITETFGGDPIDFTIGDIIEITATIDNTSRSYSTGSVVPLPPALWMLGSALGMLSFFRRAVIS